MIKQVCILAITSIFIMSCSQINKKHTPNTLCNQIRNQLMYSPSPLDSRTQPSPITTARLLKEYKSYDCEKRRQKIANLDKNTNNNKTSN